LQKSSCGLRLKRPRREQAAAGMSLDEIAAINLYTQDNQFHRALNLSLRTGQRRSACPFHPYLQILDSALSKLPPQKLVVWRGINTKLDHSYRTGTIITWWAVSSATKTLERTKYFLGKEGGDKADLPCTLFSIETENARAVQAFSSSRDEEEYILKMGTQLEVKSKVIITGKASVIHLKEIRVLDSGCYL